MNRYPEWLISTIYNNRSAFRIIFMLLFILLLIFSASRLKIDTNFEQYLEDKDLQGILRQDELFVILHSQNAEDTGYLYDLKINIEEKLRALDCIHSINLEKEYNIDNIESFFLDHFYLFMDKDQSMELSAGLSTREGIKKRLDRFYNSFGRLGELQFFTDDILNIYNDILGQLDFDKLGQQGPQYLSKDQKSLLIIIKTSFAPQEIDRNRIFLEGLKTIIEEEAGRSGMNIAESQFYDIESPDSQFSYMLAGGHIFSYYDSVTIRRDIIISITFTFIFLSLLFYLSFRGFTSLLALFSLLSFGILATYATAIVIYGRINIFVAAFSAVLLALGIDYLIHLYSTDMSITPGNAVKRLKKTYENAFSGILFGSLTTSFCFFSLYIIKFRLIQQLAVIIGSGILFMFISIILFYPVFASHPKKIISTAAGERIFKLFYSNCRLTVLISTAILFLMCIFIGLGIKRLNFDADFQTLRPRLDIPSNNLAYAFKNFDMGENNIFGIIDAKTDMVDNIHKAASFLKSKQESYNYSFFDISRIFKNTEEMEIIRDNLRKIDFSSVNRNILDLSGMYNLNSDYVMSYTGDIEKIIEEEMIMNFDELVQNSSFSSIFDRLIVYDEGSITAIMLPIRFENAKDMEAFLKHESGNGLIRFFDIGIIVGNIEKIVRDSFPYAILCAVLATFIIVFLKFRNWHALLALMPTSYSLLTVIFAMILLKIDFNYSSIIVLPIVFGIGIDDGIHFMHRFTLTKNEAESFKGVFFPVVMTSLTTIAGFGSLMFSSYTGLFQIGLLSSIGISASLFYSLFILPVYINYFRRKRKEI